MSAHGLAPQMGERNHKFRRALITLFFCLVIAALAAHGTMRAAEATDEVRALWVRQTSLESEESIRRMVASAATSGFNTLFVQVAEFAAAAQTFDPIAETIRQAHAAGLRVHAWLDVVRVAPAGELPFARDHVVYQHPEWLMVPRVIAAELLPVDVHSPDYVGRLVRWTRTSTDQIDGLYLSPALPEAASYLTEAVRDVVRRYSLDGVYLDHVRYPAADFDYGVRSIAAFRDSLRGQLDLTERQRIESMQALDPFAYAN